MTDLTSALSGTTIGGTIDTVDDALHEEVVLAAIEGVVRRRRAAVREWLEIRPDLSAALTSGDGASVDTLYGTATVTSPSLKAVTTDPEAFDRWAVEVGRAIPRDEIAWDVVRAAAESDPGIERAIADLVPDAVVERVYPDEKLARHLTTKKYAMVQDDGTIVWKDTGEVVPGVEARPASTPSLRVTPDKDRAEALAEDVYARLTPILPPPPPPEDD